MTAAMEVRAESTETTERAEHECGTNREATSESDRGRAIVPDHDDCS